jgi:hypothetical protein
MGSPIRRSALASFFWAFSDSGVSLSRPLMRSLARKRTVDPMPRLANGAAASMSACVTARAPEQASPTRATATAKRVILDR